MGDIEMGTCDVCKKENVQLNREYYRYNVKCNCCNGAKDKHFECVHYCGSCEPKAPQRISAYVDHDPELIR